MKSSFRIIAALSILAFMSCNKDLDVKNNTPRVITDFPTIVVECDVDAPVIEAETSTKVYGFVADPVNAPGRHTVKWKAGDQISQFSVVSAKGSTDLNVGDVLNFSNLRSTLRGGDGTTSFAMEIPDLMKEYGASSGLQTWLCAFYPATTFSDIQVTPEVVNNATRYHVKVKPVSLNIPAEQDGTGWKYSIFYARSAAFSAQYNSPVGGGGSKFQLLNAILRLKLNSTKNITKVVLTSSTGYMTGELTEVTLNYFHSNTAVYTNTLPSAGCPGKTLTIETGDILPDDLYFSIRELREATTYTFTFTAEDGTTTTRSFNNPSGWANRRWKNVYNLGTLTLDDWN